jgi:hypothetical protein
MSKNKLTALLKRIKQSTSMNAVNSASRFSSIEQYRSDPNDFVVTICYRTDLCDEEAYRAGESHIY